MSFHTGAGADVVSSPIYQIVFKQIFQLQPCTGTEGIAIWGCLSGNIQNDLIYGLFLPHIVLLFFLFMLGTTIRPFAEHRGMGILFSAGVYVFLIYSGWYGFLLAKFLVWWIVATIVTALGYFFLRTVWWGKTGPAYELAKAIGAKAGESIGKDQERIAEKEAEAKAKKEGQKTAKKQIDILNEQVAYLNNELNTNPHLSAKEQAEIRGSIRSAELQIRLLKKTHGI